MTICPAWTTCSGHEYRPVYLNTTVFLGRQSDADTRYSNPCAHIGWCHDQTPVLRFCRSSRSHPCRQRALTPPPGRWLGQWRVRYCLRAMLLGHPRRSGSGGRQPKGLTDSFSAAHAAQHTHGNERSHCGPRTSTQQPAAGAPPGNQSPPCYQPPSWHLALQEWGAAVARGCFMSPAPHSVRFRERRCISSAIVQCGLSQTVPALCCQL